MWHTDEPAKIASYAAVTVKISVALIYRMTVTDAREWVLVGESLSGLLGRAQVTVWKVFMLTTGVIIDPTKVLFGYNLGVSHFVQFVFNCGNLKYF